LLPGGDLLECEYLRL
ncbi:hypothetical protein D049_4758B, partial [Vibrio parahaemolyticus VPTS-2010]